MTEGLPKPTEAFTGHIGRLLADSQPRRLDPATGPIDAPNVLLIMLDDVGFGSFASFGGPVQAPAFQGVADRGLLYNQFHTTALCSPTRAALLTGRQHHTVHMGGITEIANSFPGYDSVIPAEAATVAQILQMSGYATSCFGKWHLTPSWEQGPAGPFDRWPTGLGFDRFYGIIGAEASHWEPAIYDQTTPISPHVGRPGYHLTEDLTDQALAWIERHRVSAPDRPWFCYFSTPAVHAPHHAPRDWIEQFRGKFDRGWDALRDEIYAEQRRLGVIPASTALTPRPDEIPAWVDYPERYRPIATRLMECFAGFLAHTDHHIGRVIDAARREERETLVIYLSGDNGASAEGTIHGAWSAPSFQNGVHEDPEWLLDHLDDFGTAKCENHFNVGWAWALDSPFQWMKQVASHFGGTRNGMAVSWPQRITDGGGLRGQFHHVIDLAPTILEAAGVEPPEVVNGIPQWPIEGTSMAYTFDDPAAASHRRTQYFEMLGNRGIYHDGFMASCFHGRVPWVRFAGLPFDGPQERWELYDITDDFSQSRDLANVQPDRLIEMRDLFHTEAQRNGVYPLRDTGTPMGPEGRAPLPLAGATRAVYGPAHVRMPERSVLNVKNRSFDLTARIDVPDGGARGVIVCQGGSFNGWSLYFNEAGQPSFHYNLYGHQRTTVAGPESLAPGARTIRLLFDYDGGFGNGATITLGVDGVVVADGRIERSVPVMFSMGGETFDVGVDTGSPVGPYPHRFPCTATIHDVALEILGEVDEKTRAAIAAGRFRAEMTSQ